ncbi:SDR family NAD(P)-dependent oxidoreductase [Pontiella sp.]|uniref:SDR family NAD(P)-dependent oxidoreductase n=1 Tax=Pontiella sp. TaxID=2837462 RepID=UPI0035693448
MSDKILIYGGGSGIGLALAGILLRRGNAVHVTGRTEESIAPAATLGASCTVGDVLDSDFFDRAAADAGAVLSGLVYAVGTINLKGFQRLETDDYLHDFQVNALGAARAVQASLGALKRSGKPASVVLFSSVAAGKGFPFHASIAMAKGAVNGLVVSLASELAPNVRVNAIAPSLTRTPLSEALLANPRTARNLEESHPMQRLGRAEDAASAAAFLLSDEASWITGQVIGVDGGRSTLMDPH